MSDHPPGVGQAGPGPAPIAPATAPPPTTEPAIAPRPTAALPTADPAAADPATAPPTAALPTAVFRLPRSAYLPVLFLVFGVSVLVRGPIWLLVYLIPLAAAVFVARRRTVIDAEAITVQALLGRRVVPWDQVRGLLVDERGTLSAALIDATSVPLPFVRARHLAVLAEVSGNRVPALTGGSSPQ